MIAACSKRTSDCFPHHYPYTWRAPYTWVLILWSSPGAVELHEGYFHSSWEQHTHVKQRCGSWETLMDACPKTFALPHRFTDLLRTRWKGKAETGITMSQKKVLLTTPCAGYWSLNTVYSHIKGHIWLSLTDPWSKHCSSHSQSSIMSISTELHISTTVRSCCWHTILFLYFRTPAQCQTTVNISWRFSH